MLNLSKIFFICFFISFNTQAGISQYSTLKKSQLPAMYKDLGKAISKLEKSKDKKLLKAILNIYIQHHKFDKSYYPYELLAPFYGKNKKLIIDSLKMYKKTDRELAIKNLEIAFREYQLGNG